MASPKKPASHKRADPPRTADYTKLFFKDWERLTRSGRYNMQHLKQAMLLLIANNGPLGTEWRDHALAGNWADHRECHVGGDFLLIYRIIGDGPQGAVVFVRAGTHAELFE
ncbi:MAG TPA: type II toxin-antitoxin system YafQ family toxin [Acetobacteraceae bacterium]|nr:type II toxin-antitoxin system YafQ family toxin [Acetobacteraceae bacterium]